MNLTTIAVIGGDRRIAHTIPCLEKEGFSVLYYGTIDIASMGTRTSSLCEAVNEADAIIAGIPLLSGGRIFSFEELPDLTAQKFLACLREGQHLFAGVIPGDFAAQCGQIGVTCHDFMKNESLAVFNAIATAEGALLEAIRSQETNLHSSRALVLGYGRCGRVLAQKLRALCADVTVCCRSSEALSCAETYGLHPLPLAQLPLSIHQFEYIFNTIPSVVLRGEILRKLRKDTLILDLASEPGGVDYGAVRAAGIRTLRCPGLPGKYAARTSGERLAAYVIETLSAPDRNCCGSRKPE